VRRVLAAGNEILRACVDLGGSITGEHGIGIEKVAELPLLFSPQDLLVMQQLRAVFDPDHRSNPGKIFPTPGGCVEITRPRKQAAA
jgi:glycolate oxidase